MADARIQLLHTRVLFAEGPATARISQAHARILYSFPAQEGALSQARSRIMWSGSGAVDAQASQLRVRLLIKFGADTRRLRAWTFPQDQHDFYVLTLGRDKTLIYDYLTKTWDVWKSPNMDIWRGSDGMAWEKDNVAGDVNKGILWNISANDRIDDSESGAADVNPIQSRVRGMFPHRGRFNLSCYRATLTLAQGFPIAPGVGIRMRTSVDEGLSWIDHGFLLMDEAGAKYDVSWTQLGLIEEPGMIFEIIDTGYTRRINALDIDLGEDEGGAN